MDAYGSRSMPLEAKNCSIGVGSLRAESSTQTRGRSMNVAQQLDPLPFLRDRGIMLLCRNSVVKMSHARDRWTRTYTATAPTPTHRNTDQKSGKNCEEVLLSCSDPYLVTWTVAHVAARDIAQQPTLLLMIWIPLLILHFLGTILARSLDRQSPVPPWRA